MQVCQMAELMEQCKIFTKLHRAKQTFKTCDGRVICEVANRLWAAHMKKSGCYPMCRFITVTCEMCHSARVQTKVHDIKPMRNNTWIHPNSCTHYASLAFSQIPNWIQPPVDHLQRQGTSYIQEMITPSEGKYSMRSNKACVLKLTKFTYYVFRQACICSVKASGLELLDKWN